MTGEFSEHLSFPVSVVSLPAKGLRIKLAPNEAECAVLAKEAAGLSLESFHCELLYKRWHKNGVAVSGELRAELTQECVVSLEPVKSTIEEEIDRIFVPDGSKFSKPRLNNEGEMIFDYEEKDEPEPFVGDTLDAWEIALEHFLLGVDPFPRKDGSEFNIFEKGSQTKSEGDDQPSPFAALKGLLQDKDD